MTFSIMHSVVMLNVPYKTFMLSDIMLNVVILSVVAPLSVTTAGIIAKCQCTTLCQCKLFLTCLCVVSQSFEEKIM